MLNQIKDLNAVIAYIRTLDFVDVENIYLLGSSMGGATVATANNYYFSDCKIYIMQEEVSHQNGCETSFEFTE